MSKNKFDSMRVVKCESQAPKKNDSLIDRLQRELQYSIGRYGYICSGAWQQISQISLIPQDEQPDAEVVFYADIHSISDGKTWAPAKHCALFTGADYTAPMDIMDLANRIASNPDLASTDMAQDIIHTATFEELTKEQLDWIVDVDYGPGLAPGYGGLKIPVQITYRDENGNLVVRDGWVMSSFSGAKDWQDIFMAIANADEMIKAIGNYDPTVRVSCDYSLLRKDTSIALWLDLTRDQ